MNITNTKAISAAVLAALMTSVILPTTVNAQQMDALEEIVVVAERREQNVQTVPVSIAAFSAEAMAKAGIITAHDIASRTPSLQLNFTNLGEPEFYIRGIGTDIESAGANNGVGIFVDSIYLARGAGSISELFDLQRVEVLRGPQGTHLGKSTSGGAINYITNLPSHETDAKFVLEVGNYDSIATKGMVNGELSENVAGRLSFSSRTNSGYVSNVITGNDLGDHDATAARGSLLFTPTENTTIQLSADTYAKRGGSIPSKLVYASRPALNGDGDPIPGADPLPDPVAQQWIDGLGDREQRSFTDGYEDVDSDSVTLLMTFELGSTTLTSTSNIRSSSYSWNQNSTGQPYPEGITYQVYDFQWGPGNVFSSNCFGPFFPPGQRACWGSAGSLTYADGADSPYWEQFSDEEVDQWSQELRLASNSDGRFSWMVGAYYGIEEIRRVDEVDFAIRFGDGYTFPCCFGPTGPSIVGGGRWHEGHEYKGSNADVDTLGIFLTVDFDLSDNVRLSLGTRYSEDTKDFWMDVSGRALTTETTDENGDGTGAWDPVTDTYYPDIDWTAMPSREWLANPGTPTVDNTLEMVPITFGEKDSWDNVSSFVSLSWRASEDTMFYGRVSQGFKGGGYEGLSASGITFLGDTKFEEETALNYEAGIKTDFWDGKARVNLSGFFTEYEGLQMQVLVPVFDDMGNQIESIQLTTNVGDAEVAGAELEFTILLFDGMALTGSYGYLDTEIKDDVLVQVNDDPVMFDNYRGNELAKSPNKSVNLAADYGWSLANSATAYLRVEYSWTAENYSKNDSHTEIPAQDYIDASFTLVSPDDKWEFRVFGKNLTDELLLANIGASGDHSQRFRPYRFYHDLAAPRTYGVSFTWNY